MNYQRIEQRSNEWWDLKVGKISGTRFGQLISTRENMLSYEVVDEILNGFVSRNDFINDEMQFGIDNEEQAISLYEEETGLKFERGGVIMSDFSEIHMASPDAVNLELGIVVEVKCTMHGKTHLKRFFDGPDDKYMPQILNYFAVSDDVKEVHFVSYCPFRAERPIVSHVIKRNTILNKKGAVPLDYIITGRDEIKMFERDIKIKQEQFLTINKF